MSDVIAIQLQTRFRVLHWFREKCLNDFFFLDNGRSTRITGSGILDPTTVRLADRAADTRALAPPQLDPDLAIISKLIYFMILV